MIVTSRAKIGAGGRVSESGYTRRRKSKMKQRQKKGTDKED